MLVCLLVYGNTLKAFRFSNQRKMTLKEPTISTFTKLDVYALIGYERYVRDGYSVKSILFANTMLLIYSSCLLSPISAFSYQQVMTAFHVFSYCSFSIIKESIKC